MYVGKAIMVKIYMRTGINTVVCVLKKLVKKFGNKSSIFPYNTSICRLTLFPFIVIIYLGLIRNL